MAEWARASVHTSSARGMAFPNCRNARLAASRPQFVAWRPGASWAPVPFGSAGGRVAASGGGKGSSMFWGMTCSENRARHVGRLRAAVDHDVSRGFSVRRGWGLA